jgi:hypothetical protein
MKRTLIGILFLCAFSVDAASARCIDEVPHYAGQGYGPGRIIFSLFALPTSLAVTVMATPFGQGRKAVCQPLYHAGAIYVARQRWDNRKQ